MTEAEFTAWLIKYKEAWEKKDIDAFVSIFTENATYQEHAFHDKARGREAIRAYAEHNISTMKDIHFSFEVYCVSGNVGLCHWAVSLKHVETDKPVEVDGIFRCVFEMEADKVLRCSEFREWWFVKGTKDYKEMEAEELSTVE